MSRIGKQPIAIPANTEVRVENAAVHVKGGKGELSRPLHPSVKVEVKDSEVVCTPVDTSVQARALWGTFASHIANMVKGVNEPYEKKLIIEGVGYRAQLQGKELELMVGYSHPVKLNVPEGLEVNVEKSEITISGIDKDKVGQFAAEVRATRKPEPYKGKGIRYSDEVIRRKEGKKTA